MWGKRKTLEELEAELAKAEQAEHEPLMPAEAVPA
jgi:hypothetical protein